MNKMFFAGYSISALYWGAFSSLFFLALADVRADLPVSYVEMVRQTGFASERAYAGKTLPSRSSDLGFKRGGEIASVFVDIGDIVERGQLLASLDRRAFAASLSEARAEVALAQANLSAAKAQAQLAANTEKRFRKLRQEGNTSKQIYDEAKLSLQTKKASYRVAKANVDRAKAARNASSIAFEEGSIKAPFDGIIQSRYMDEGSQIGSGMPALKLIERGPIKAHIGIPNESANNLTIGESYTINWGHQSQSALLTAISPEVDQASRTLTAVFKIPANTIPIGVVVELLLKQIVPEVGFWVPVSALTASDRGLWTLYVVNAENIIERRLVEIVHNESSRAYVRGLLSDRERLVSAGSQRVVPGQSVLPVLSAESFNARR